MGQTPDQLRRDIENTREHLGDTLGAIEDHVSPRAIMERRRSAMADRWSSMRDAVMGRADDLASSASGTVQGVAGNATDTVRDAPQLVAQGTQGSPWAAGVIAFGAGLLAAQLLPVTRTERQQADRILDEARPLTDEVKQIAADVGADLRDEGRERVEELKGDVTDAAGAVRDTARSAADDTRDAGQAAARDVGQAGHQDPPAT